MCHYSQIMTHDGLCAYPVVKYEGIASKNSQLASSFIKTRVRSKPVFASKKKQYNRKSAFDCLSHPRTHAPFTANRVASPDAVGTNIGAISIRWHFDRAHLTTCHECTFMIEKCALCTLAYNVFWFSPPCDTDLSHSSFAVLTASTAIIKFDLDASSDRSLDISRWKELSEGCFVASWSPTEDRLWLPCVEISSTGRTTWMFHVMLQTRVVETILQAWCMIGAFWLMRYDAGGTGSNFCYHCPPHGNA